MFNYAFLIPIFPLLAFLLIVFFLNRNNKVSALTAVAGIFFAGVVSYGVLFEAVGKGAELAKKPFYAKLPLFLQLPTGDKVFEVGVMIDPLVAMTLFMVTTVCLMIFIYSIGYMRHSHTDEHGHHHVSDDPRYARFFAYISLFACGMLGLVISSNLFQFFLFWEIMGLCSYLLIGFWYAFGRFANRTNITSTMRKRCARNLPRSKRFSPRVSAIQFSLSASSFSTFMPAI